MATRLMLATHLLELAAELEVLLRRAGQDDLVEQVAALPIVERCRCGDDFCATIYTAPKSRGGWGAGHENIVLEPANGFLVLDVIDREIVCIEALYRDAIREKLLKLLP